MNKYWFYKVGLVVVFLCFALLSGAKVKLPALVSDGMVLQRGEQVQEGEAEVANDNQQVILIKNSDLGEWNDIHPLNKKTLGERLSQAVSQQKGN